MHRDLKIANRLLAIGFLPTYQKFHQWAFSTQVASLYTALQKFCDHQAEITIIFPPSLDWSEQIFQRPQQIARALSKQGAQIFYFQHREHWETTPFREILPGLVLCSAPIEAAWRLPKRRLFSYAMTWNCRSAIMPNIEGMIYDYVDDLNVFAGSQSRLANDHSVMMKKAHLLLATSERLLDKAQKYRKDALLCQNGVDYEHFANRKTSLTTPPDDINAIVTRGEPIAGYIGAMARWLDYPLMIETAKARSDWQFVLIGPDHDHSIPELLLTLPNVHWLGLKPYSVLPDYMRFFNAALVPFQINQVTDATSPVKLYEYMAAGIPVISTPIHEANKAPGVLIARYPSQFALCLDEALVLNQDVKYLAQIDRFARQNTWDIRATLILESLRDNTHRSTTSTGIISP